MESNITFGKTSRTRTFAVVVAVVITALLVAVCVALVVLYAIDENDEPGRYP